MNESVIMKLIIMGDANVGKSSIRKRFFEGTFDEQYTATIGTAFSSKEALYNKKMLKMVLWDLGGQKAFKDLRMKSYTGTLGIIAVYDVTRKETYHNISKWILEVFEATKNNIPPIIIVGNKMDINMREVHTKDGEDLSIMINDRLKIETGFIEVSAKTGENIRDAFAILLSKVLSLNEVGKIDT